MLDVGFRSRLRAKPFDLIYKPIRFLVCFCFAGLRDKFSKCSFMFILPLQVALSTHVCTFYRYAMQL